MKKDPEDVLAEGLKDPESIVTEHMNKGEQYREKLPDGWDTPEYWAELRRDHIRDDVESEGDDDEYQDEDEAD